GTDLHVGDVLVRQRVVAGAADLRALGRGERRAAARVHREFDAGRARETDDLPGLPRELPVDGVNDQLRRTTGAVVAVLDDRLVTGPFAVRHDGVALRRRAAGSVSHTL